MAPGGFACVVRAAGRRAGRVARSGWGRGLGRGGKGARAAPIHSQQSRRAAQNTGGASGRRVSARPPSPLPLAPGPEPRAPRPQARARRMSRIGLLASAASQLPSRLAGARSAASRRCAPPPRAAAATAAPPLSGRARGLSTARMRGAPAAAASGPAAAADAGAVPRPAQGEGGGEDPAAAPVRTPKPPGVHKRTVALHIAYVGTAFSGERSRPLVAGRAVEAAAARPAHVAACARHAVRPPTRPVPTPARLLQACRPTATCHATRQSKACSSARCCGQG
jgi:hypothetical protein